MSAIWKYPLTTDGLVEVKVGAEVLCVGAQRGQPFIWMLVDPVAGTELRSFVLIPTGQSFDPLGLKYLGSCHAVDGWMVFHIYEETGVV